MSPRLRAVLGWRQAPPPEAKPEARPDLALMVTLEPFPVPPCVWQKMNPAKRQDGFIKATNYPLGELPQDTLLALCDDFRRRVLLTAATQRAEQRKRPAR